MPVNRQHFLLHLKFLEYQFDPSASPKLFIASTSPEEKVLPTSAKPETGRNDPCPCGSGKKHKKCCEK